MEHLHLIGPGRLGLALADALAEAEAVTAIRVCGRHPDPPAHPLFTQGIAEYAFGLGEIDPETTVVVLAVPDTVLPELAHALAAHPPPREGLPVLHTAGTLSGDVLAPLHARGYSAGTFFPLMTVPHAVPGARLFEGAGVVVSGERDALGTARRLAFALGARPIEIAVARRTLAHAASLLVSTGIAGLIAAAEDLLARAGVESEVSRASLLHVGESALDGIARFGPVRGVTGPVTDGDIEAAALHMRALPPEIQGLYREVGRAALRRHMEEVGSDPTIHDHFIELFGEDG
ncbi:MAG: Rossmann-like and DUF2520 domain-containing protein [Longimicrobiales bacterium]|nr:Rossmann-like and DUF2520 domain-containing protein [Longimicrobiales bacterium]